MYSFSVFNGKLCSIGALWGHWQQCLGGEYFLPPGHGAYFYPFIKRVTKGFFVAELSPSFSIFSKRERWRQCMKVTVVKMASPQFLLDQGIGVVKAVTVPGWGKPRTASVVCIEIENCLFDSFE